MWLEREGGMGDTLVPPGWPPKMGLKKSPLSLAPCRFLATCQGLSHERLVGTGGGENGRRWEVEVGQKSGHKGGRGVSKE